MWRGEPVLTCSFTAIYILFLFFFLYLIIKSLLYFGITCYSLNNKMELILLKYKNLKDKLRLLIDLND